MGLALRGLKVLRRGSIHSKCSVCSAEGSPPSRRSSTDTGYAERIAAGGEPRWGRIPPLLPLDLRTDVLVALARNASPSRLPGARNRQHSSGSEGFGTCPGGGDATPRKRRDPGNVI